MNEIGRPLTSVSRTSCQSCSVVFSTIAQPCNSGAVVVFQHQPVAGFPQRGFLDIADAHRPLARAEKPQRDVLFVARMALGQDRQRVLQFGVRALALQANLARRVQRNAAQAGRRHEIEHLDFDDLVLAHLLLAHFDAQDLSGHRRRRFDRHALAAHLPQQIADRRFAGQIDRKGFQRFGDRIARAVGDGRNSSAPLIFEHHALEQIVDVGDVEFQIDVGVARDFALSARRIRRRK